jgi:hypothetical protein
LAPQKEQHSVWNLIRIREISQQGALRMLLPVDVVQSIDEDERSPPVLDEILVESLELQMKSTREFDPICPRDALADSKAGPFQADHDVMKKITGLTPAGLHRIGHIRIVPDLPFRPRPQGFRQ